MEYYSSLLLGVEKYLTGPGRSRVLVESQCWEWVGSLQGHPVQVQHCFNEVSTLARCVGGRGEGIL